MWEKRLAKLQTRILSFDVQNSKELCTSVDVRGICEWREMAGSEGKWGDVTVKLRVNREFHAENCA